MFKRLIFGLFLISIQCSYCKAVSSFCEQIPEYNGANCSFQNVYSLKEFNFFVKSLKMANLNRVSFDVSHIPEFPSIILESLPNVEHFEARDVGMKTITPFAEFNPHNKTSFGSINLSFNKLKKIDAKVFEGLRILQFLDISNNEITSIDVLAFDGASINSLVLANNLLKKLDFMKGTSNILSLDMSFNPIEKIDFEDLEFQSRFIDELKLNNLDKFKSFECRSSTQFRSLVMRNNPLLVFVNLNHCHINRADITDSDEVKNIILGPYLSELKADNTLLADIQFDKSGPLKKLSIVNGSLSNGLANQILKRDTLEELNLSNNNLKSLSKLDFSHLKALFTLKMENCGLSDIQFNTFANLKRLVTLNINGNGLRTINLMKFLPLASLQNLEIANNQLTELITFDEVSDILPTLKSIDLSGNELPCAHFESLMHIFNVNNIKVEGVSEKCNQLDDDDDDDGATDDVGEADDVQSQLKIANQKLDDLMSVMMVLLRDKARAGEAEHRKQA